jgi:hypothetical protein
MKPLSLGKSQLLSNRHLQMRTRVSNATESMPYSGMPVLTSNVDLASAYIISVKPRPDLALHHLK